MIESLPIINTAISNDMQIPGSVPLKLKAYVLMGRFYTVTQESLIETTSFLS